LGFLAGCSDGGKEITRFEDTFLFGTGVSGFEVEMGCPTLPGSLCDDPHSDWYVWTTSPEAIESKNTHLSGEDPTEVCPGHWELYETDFDLAAGELANNAYRIGIEWSRIFPEPTDEIEGFAALREAADPRAVEHYHNVLMALRQRGLAPIVAINHYTLPAWIHDAIRCHQTLGGCKQRGWLDHERIVREISKYAGYLAAEYGDQVDIWLTLHGPYQIMFSGYLWPAAEKANPPAVWLKTREAKQVYHALVDAHARMYDAVKASDLVDADSDGQAARIGISYSASPTRPKDPEDTFDVRGAENVDYLWNKTFLNAMVAGDFDEEIDGNVVRRDDLAGRMDFIGLGYYGGILVKGTRRATFPQMSPFTTFDPFDIGGIDDPRGLYEMLLTLHQDYGLPILVAGNGTDDRHDNGTASAYIVRHLVWLQRARSEGVKVFGYLYSTLTDTYDWNHGTVFRFGLYQVDSDDPLRSRIPRGGAATYGAIASAGEVPADLLELYPVE
jgi:beta-glucosidase/6-phospho-beta-glucosidase/beta-galactosidase